ncbi:MAG: transposase [Caldilineaceae bacterium SB0664_bin_27]|uniref:Transposase n=1 Tax=Caldilineaceae bacterium SB0664_bin_27 TaxID=2605260 RepID=A0A6B0Z1A2_9CHLR|nr:transposase [Caldilineaceae bacterium SB0664_bin_27]
MAIAEGSKVAEAARRIGVTEQTIYRWRSEYGVSGSTRPDA